MGKHRFGRNGREWKTFFIEGGSTFLNGGRSKICLTTMVGVKLLLYGDISLDLATNTPILKTTVNLILSSKK